MKYAIIFATTCMAMGMLISCTQQKPEPQQTNFSLSDSMAHMITLDTAKICDVTYEVNLSGEVSFNENDVVNIFPRVSGQVVETKVTVGDNIHKGQVLAVIHSADVAGNYSDLTGAVASEMIAKRELDNTKMLYDNGISSQKDYDEALENYKIAQAAKEKAEILYKINSQNNGNKSGTSVITSPIDGYVVQKNVTVGTFVRPDMGNNLFTISNLETVWVYANVYEADVPKIKEGNTAKVSLVSYPGKVFDGEIQKVSDVLDSSSKSIGARIVIKNENKLLKPQMFANIQVQNRALAGGSIQAVCVPSSSLIMQDGKMYVVVYRNEHEMFVKEVKILQEAGTVTYIQGIDAGDIIISKNQLLIFNQLVQKI